MRKLLWSWQESSKLQKTRYRQQEGWRLICYVWRKIILLKQRGCRKKNQACEAWTFTHTHFTIIQSYLQVCFSHYWATFSKKVVTTLGAFILRVVNISTKSFLLFFYYLFYCSTKSNHYITLSRLKLQLIPVRMPEVPASYNSIQCNTKQLKTNNTKAHHTKLP